MLVTWPFDAIDFDLQTAAISYAHAHALTLNAQFDAINQAHAEALADNAAWDRSHDRPYPDTEWELHFGPHARVVARTGSTLSARNALAARQ